MVVCLSGSAGSIYKAGGLKRSRDQFEVAWKGYDDVSYVILVSDMERLTYLEEEKIQPGDKRKRKEVDYSDTLTEKQWLRVSWSGEMVAVGLGGGLQFTTHDLTSIGHFYTFVLKVYIKSWFTSPCASSAPNNDLLLLRELENYKKTNKAVANAALKSYSGHLWYLNNVLIGLAFFDSEVSSATKSAMFKSCHDAAERGVALIQEFNRVLTNGEDQLQYLFQVIEKHRKDFPNPKKSTIIAARRK
ncbi:hypothetical protein HELRODRAFT_184710 [Helobdella robusta]|uniref:Snf2 ATP coupling domain-containing protein n=1 Tax=Helobdella robusta TaxID=6412 RepID=T1FLU0_HELRO|nr:hypothetical protein HELRODRAFT_184710 [Helobdella robusta]ESO04140.1 hypothetical protein HELRODRAFT_184710 [Helobdella robusta]